MYKRTQAVVYEHELTDVYVKSHIILFASTLLTLVNTLLLVFQVGFSFYFSMYAPEYFYWIGYFLEADQVQNGIIVGNIIALSIVALYLLCCQLSKKNSAWMTVAVFLIIADSLLLLLDVVMYLPSIDFGLIISMGFNGFLMYHFVKGARAGHKLAKLQPETFEVEGNGDVVQ